MSLTSVCPALEQLVSPTGAGLCTPSHALTRPLSKLTGSASRLSGVEVAHGASAGKRLEWAWPGQPPVLCTQKGGTTCQDKVVRAEQKQEVDPPIQPPGRDS